MYVKKIHQFLSNIKKEAHKRKLVPFFLPHGVVVNKEIKMIVTWRDFSPESDGAIDDLAVCLERDVAADHRVEKDAQRPHGAGVAFVELKLNPLRWTVHSRTCNSSPASSIQVTGNSIAVTANDR